MNFYDWEVGISSSKTMIYFSGFMSIFQKELNLWLSKEHRKKKKTSLKLSTFSKSLLKRSSARLSKHDDYISKGWSESPHVKADSDSEWQPQPFYDQQNCKQVGWGRDRAERSVRFRHCVSLLPFVYFWKKKKRCMNEWIWAHVLVWVRANEKEVEIFVSFSQTRCRQRKNYFTKALNITKTTNDTILRAWTK